MNSMPRSGGSCSAGSGAEVSAHRAIEAALALIAATLIVTTWLTSGSPAGAESPSALAAGELASDGVYVAPGRADMAEEDLTESIEKARALGLRLVVVAPDDPQPTAIAFARRVQEASDADAAIVFPPEGGLEAHVIDELESARFRALDEARGQPNPALAVDAFTTELLAEPSQALPPIVRQVVLLVLVLAFILAGTVALEQLRRRSRAQELPIGRDDRPAPTDWRHPTTGTAGYEPPPWPGPRTGTG